MRKVLRPLRFNASSTSVSGKDLPMNTRLLTPPQDGQFLQCIFKGTVSIHWVDRLGFAVGTFHHTILDHFQLGFPMGIQCLGDWHKISLV